MPDTAVLNADGSLALVSVAEARAAVRNMVNLPDSVAATTVAGRDGNVILGTAARGHVDLTGSVTVDSDAGIVGSIVALG